MTMSLIFKFLLILHFFYMGTYPMHTSFPGTLRAHQLLNIKENSKQNWTHTSNRITHTCEILSSNSLYFSRNKERQNPDIFFSFKTVEILSFFLLWLKYNEFEYETFHICVILLGVNV